MRKVLFLLALVVLPSVARCHDFYDEDIPEFRYDGESSFFSTGERESDDFKAVEVGSMFDFFNKNSLKLIDNDNEPRVFEIADGDGDE